MSGHSNTTLSHQQQVEALQAEVDTLKRRLQENEQAIAKMHETFPPRSRTCLRSRSENRNNASVQTTCNESANVLRAKATARPCVRSITWPCKPEDITQAYQVTAIEFHPDHV